MAEYGHRLVCVRYRCDAAARLRYKTVELIVEQVPWDPAEHALDPAGRPGRPPSLVGVQVAYEHRALQQRGRQSGGRRLREQRVWVLLLAAAKRLGLEHRLVPVPDVLVSDGVESRPQVYHGKLSDKPLWETPGETHPHKLRTGREVYHEVDF